MSILSPDGNTEGGLQMERLPFEVLYTQTYSPLISTLQEQMIPKAKIDQISSNVFEHPSLNLTSLFENVRNSDYQLSNQDTTSLQTFLGECKNDINTLDEKIKHTISTIAKLSRDLTETSARMVQKLSQVKLCEYILSQPKHLPQDVLEQIFLACLQSIEAPEPHPNRAPLQLAAVSHRWRVIALSMPILWSNIFITTTRSLELAMIYAQRCYMPSLTVNMDGSRSTDMVRFKEFFAALEGPSLQIRRIDFRASEAEVRIAIHEFLLDREHPVLEELALRDDYIRFPKLPTAPIIKRLYMYKMPKSWDEALPPAQLTVLWVTVEIHWTLLEAFLAQCPNLESLYVSLSENGFRPPINENLETNLSKDLTAQHLTYFAISNDCKSEEPPEDLLRGVVFPTLQVVEYCVTKRGVVVLPWLVFNPSLGHIRRFTLQFDDGCALSQDTFLRILEPATALEELAISCAHATFRDVLSVIASLPTSPLGDRAILPKLKRLYLAIEGKFDLWLDLESQISSLAQAWSTPTSESSDLPTPEGLTHTLTRLTILHRYENDSQIPKRNEDALKIREMIRANSPGFSVGIIAYRTISWFWDVPTMFGMYPQPFNKIKPHEVLEDDDSWTTKVSSLFTVL